MRTVLLSLTLLLVQTPQTPVTREIRGVVTSIGTPDAVPDAEISVGIDKSDLDTVIAAYKYNQKFPKRTTSDGSGHFSVAGVVPGKFIVTVQHDGFFATAPDAKGNVRDSVSVPVTVAADQDGTEIAVPMLAGAVVAGRVFGLDGQVLPRVTVQAFTQFTEDGVSKLKLVVERSTNDEGAYRLFWLPPGDYFVAVASNGSPVDPAIVLAGFRTYLRTFYRNAADESTATPVTVKSSDDLTSIDINLRPGPSVDLRTLNSMPPPPPPPPPAR